MSDEGITSRGFSGPTKFSEFRRTATTTTPANNSGDSSASSKGGSKTKKTSDTAVKARDLSEHDWLIQTNETAKFGEVPLKSEQFEVSQGTTEQDKHRVLGHVSGALSAIAHEAKDFITHEIKDKIVDRR